MGREIACCAIRRFILPTTRDPFNSDVDHRWGSLPEKELEPGVDVVDIDELIDFFGSEEEFKSVLAEVLFHDEHKHDWTP